MQISNNYGVTWKQNNLPNIGSAGQISMSASGQYQTVIADSSNYIYTSSNFGNTFTLNPNVSSSSWTYISLSASGQYQTAVVKNVTGYGIFTSIDFGNLWSPNTSAPTNVAWNCVSMSASGQYQVACVTGGSTGAGIYTSIDFGHTWTLQNSAVQNVNYVCVSASGQYITANWFDGINTIVYTSTAFINTNGPAQNSISIGYNKGYTGQSANSILLNASGNGVTGGNTGFFVNPINSYRGATGALQYNIITSEITYNSSKTFVIDHPNNSEKYLIHACLEGPEAGVYYRGTSEIINQHSITILLPDYVANVATDLTIQLTPIYNEKSDNSRLRTSKVINNQFTVYGSNGEFFWTVFGKRNHIQVEPYKNSVQVKGSGPYQWI